MLSVYFRFIKDKYLSLIVYIVSTVAFLEMYVALFPTFGSVAMDKINVLLDSYPKEIWTVFGLDPANLNFSKISTFVASEQYSIIWPIIVVVLAISLANSMISAEVENGTMEQTLALPLQRWKVFAGRYAAAVSLLAVFAFTTVYSIVPLTMIHKINLDGMNNLPLAVSGLLFGITILSIAALASALFSDKSKSSFVTAGFVIAMYGINIVGGLKADMAYLKDYSFFHYLNGATNIVKGLYVENFLQYFLTVSLIFTALALVRYIFRDTSV
jgi:ABC-2 type transport system permease protein